MSLALNVDGDHEDEVQSEEFSIHAEAEPDKGEDLDEDGAFTYPQDLTDSFTSPGRAKATRNKITRESTDRKKQATKIWIKNVLARKEDTEDQTGVGREYLFVAYVCTFKHNAITPGVFWTIFTEIFAGLKIACKNPRIKLNRQSEVEIVFPGMKKNQIPCHQDERFRYVPFCELKPFNYGPEWKLENPNDANIIESVFGSEGPPPLNLEEMRNYLMRRRDHEFEAFYNPWNPTLNPRPKRPEYQQEHIAAKRKRSELMVVEEESVHPAHKYDIWENSKNYFVVFDAPGVDPNQIQIELFPDYLKVIYPRFQYEQTFIHSHPDYHNIHSSRGFSPEGDKPAIFIIPLPGPISNSNKEHRHVENENGTVRMRILKDLSDSDSQLAPHDE
eukprot:TRINITY_DN6560_c0_g1_i1.p1 TRINITY_DN6560_c0_g1~~TRINITY_DN6560_c0_g1_i1.p1  ORF type:complete len:388 (+),score=107.42 TRINITY_DN6560_c0_g1_i1:93-1256(+)